MWDSKRDWQRFDDERVEPVVHAVFMAVGFTRVPPDLAVQELKLVGVWVGA